MNTYNSKDSVNIMEYRKNALKLKKVDIPDWYQMNGNGPQFKRNWQIFYKWIETRNNRIHGEVFINENWEKLTFEWSNVIATRIASERVVRNKDIIHPFIAVVKLENGTLIDINETWEETIFDLESIKDIWRIYPTSIWNATELSVTRLWPIVVINDVRLSIYGRELQKMRQENNWYVLTFKLNVSNTEEVYITKEDFEKEVKWRRKRYKQHVKEDEKQMRLQEKTKNNESINAPETWKKQNITSIKQNVKKVLIAVFGE